MRIFTKFLFLLLSFCLWQNSIAQTTITIGTGTTASLTTDNGNPIYRSSATSAFGWAISAHVYTASQLTALPSGSNITSFAFNKTSAFGTASGRNATMNVYMRNSTNTTLPVTTTRGTIQGYTLVYTNTAQTIPTTTGFIPFTLTTPFAYTGGSLEIYVDWAVNGASSGLSGGSFLWEYTTVTSSQTIGTSSSAALTTTTVLGTAQARSYNLQLIYTIPAGCTGAPTGGTTAVGSPTFCLTAPVNFTVTGGTSASGLTYLWEYSSDNTTYAAAAGTNTSATYSIASAAATDAGYYRRTTTCMASGLSASSTPIQVTQNSFLNCYCAASASSTADEEITNVTFGTINNTSNCTTVAPGVGSLLNRYANYTATSTSVSQGTSVPFSVTVGSCGTINYTSGLAIFIDFNQNGVFESSEKVYSNGATANINNIPASIVSGTIAIPVSALTGNTVMRVMNSESNSGDAITGCSLGTPTTYGEVEDYTVNILVGTPCSGPPTAAIASTSKSSLCTGETSVLSATGLPSTIGNTYQWFSSDDGLTFNPIGTATSSYAPYTTPAAAAGYTAKIYHLDISCSGQSTSSNDITVNAPSAPPTQASAIVFTGIGATGATIGCTAGNGGRRAIFVNSSNSFVDPTNGASPGTAATAWANTGQQLVYDGTGTSVTISALAPGTTYYARVYEYKQCVAPDNYFNTTTATNNPNSFTTTPALGFTVTRNPSAPYTSIIGAGGTPFTWSTPSSAPAVNTSWITDENYSVSVSLPFAFTYQGAAITKFKAHVNGFITLSDNAITSQLASNSINTTSAGQDKMIAPLLADLVTPGNPNTIASLQAANAPIQYAITGTAPNRVLTVEWQGMERYTIPSPNLNFQVKLYEGSNNIEFSYGQMEGYNGSVAVTWSYYVGMNGVAPATDYFTQQNFDTDYFKNTSTTLPIVSQCNSSYTFVPNPATVSSGSAPTAAAPSNDNSSAAITIPVATEDPYTANIGLCGTFFNSTGATASPEAVCAGTADDDVWFKVTPATSGVTVKVRASATFTPRVQILDATFAPLTTPVCVVATGAGLTATAAFPTTALSDYYIRVYNDGTGAGSGQFSIVAYDTPFPPANDNCSGAVVLTSGGSTCTMSALQNTANATASTITTLTGTVATGTPDDDVWFKFTPAASANYNIHVQGQSGFNPAVHVLKYAAPAAPDCATLVGVKAQDVTSTAGLESVLMTALKQDTSYLIRVFHSGSGAGTGKFTICISDAYTANFDANSCVGYAGIALNGTTFSGWFNFVSNQSAAVPSPSGLNLQINPQGVDMGTVTVNFKENLPGAANVPSGPASTANPTGLKYLPRFFGLSATPSSTFSGPVRMRLYFSNQELADYNAAMGGTSYTYNDLNLSLISDGTGSSDCDPLNNTNSAGEIATIVSRAATPNGFYLEFETTHFTEFAALQPASPLPITLKSFSASEKGNVNMINWETAIEQNLRNFEVEKSNNGLSWITLGNKNPDANKRYEMMDNNPYNTTYYRLKNIDKDGRFEYSNPVVVERKIGKFNITSIAPNPTSSDLTVKFENIDNSNVNITVLDIFGKVVLTQSTISTSGINTTMISTSNLPSGTYLLNINNGVNTLTQRFIKQ